MSCDVQKWECPYCTYLNWQTSYKCIMCRSPKPLEVIEEGAPPPSTGEDVSLYSSKESQGPTFGYNNASNQNSSVQTVDAGGGIIHSYEASGGGGTSKRQSPIDTNLSNTDTKAQTLISDFDPVDAIKIRTDYSSIPGGNTGAKTKPAKSHRKNNWTCLYCTAINWSSASSCTQCNTTPAITCLNSSIRESYTSNERAEPLKISELANCFNNKEGFSRSSVQKQNASPNKSPTQVSSFPEGAEKFIANSKDSNDLPNRDKWTCRACTFDNWPRSLRCVMCMCARIYDQSVGFHEIKQGNNYSNLSKNISVESVMAPALASLSLGVGNNRGSNFEDSGYDVDENTVNAGYTDAIRMRMYRNSEIDRKWLEACCGAVDGNIESVREYIASGGDPTRKLTEAEALTLDRPSAFDTGFTLIHLALRFHQENVLAALLSQVDGGPAVVKRVPSYAAPNIANDIRRQVLGSIRPRKGTFRCQFASEIASFTLPSEIDDLPPDVQETLFDEVLDRDVQKELEEGHIINWSVEVTDQLNSRLFALWNRTAGDCLLDSVLQASWGIFDRENGLRRALSDSLHDCASQFYQRWKENELFHARLLNFSLNEAQITADWAKLLALASQPGSSLEQLHIFALAHILRRPIIVYGVKYVKSFRGETLGFARYEGVYLPFLWEPAFCWRWPLALGYTRGHFSALLPMEPDCDPMARVDSAAQLDTENINARSIYLPLTTVEGALLPIHFLTQSEIGKEEFILSQWLDISFSDNGVMVARQRIQKRPLLVAQMVEEWLNHYRRLGQMTSTPYMRQSTATCYSSEGESDND